MTTQTAAEGRFARITSGADAIEIKGALKRYKLTQHNDDERLVYFFDTPDPKLLAAGIIVRARRASEKRLVKSASFAMPLRKGLIKRVVTRDGARRRPR